MNSDESSFLLGRNEERKFKRVSWPNSAEYFVINIFDYQVLPSCCLYGIFALQDDRIVSS